MNKDRNIINITVANTAYASVKRIKNWFESAIPDPTGHNIHSQIGVHLEEVTEMLQTLQSAGATLRIREEIGLAADVMHYLQKQIKAYTNGAEIVLSDVNRTEMLDSLCDQIVTAVGLAHMLKMDIEGALEEVAASNDSKFDKDGLPIFNEQQKIMKGPDYFPPNLSRFV